MRTLFCLSFSFIVYCGSAQQPNLILPLGHTRVVETAQFSHDDKYIVTGSADKTAKIWETFSGKKIRELGGNRKGVSYAFFSNNDKYVVVGTDSSVRIWTVPTYKMVAEFFPIQKAFISPDNKKIFLLNFNGSVRQIDAASMRTEFLYKDSAVKNTVNTSNDGKMICTAGTSLFTVREIKTGKIITRQKLDTIPLACFFSNDGGYLMVVTRKGLQRFDVKRNFQGLHPISQETGKIFLSRNSRFLLTTNGYWPDRESSILWDLDKHKISFYSDTVLSVEDSILVPLLTDPAVMIYKAGALRYGFPKWLSLRPAEISDDGKYIRCLNLFWNINDNGASYQIDGNSILKSDFSNDGNYILVQQQDGLVGLWDINARKVIQRYRTGADNIQTVAISSDGKQFLVGGSDSTVKICETATAHLVRLLKGHKGAIASAAFSHDDSLVLTNSFDTTAKLWKVSSGEVLQTISGHFPDINRVYFSGENDKLEAPTPIIDTFSIFDLDGNVARDTAILRYPKNPDATTTRKSRTGRYTLRSTNNDVGSLSWLDDAFGENNSKTWGTDFSLNAFSADEKLLALGQVDHDTLLILDIENNKWLFTGRLGLDSADWYDDKTLVQLLFAGPYLLAVDANATIRVLSAHTGKQKFEMAGQRCAVSANQEYMVVANQGECDVYDIKKWRLLYRYISVDANNYLVVDSLNRFDGTEAARKMLYYVCGHEIIDLEQIKGLSWEPDLVSKIMGVNKEPITAKKLSEINICNYTPQTKDKVLGNGLYQYTITPRRGGIKDVQLYVNNKLVQTFSPAQLKKKDSSYVLEFNRSDFAGYFVSGLTNRVMVKATTGDGAISSRGVEVEAAPEKRDSSTPDLYLVSIGISEYNGEKLKLGFASDDARAFASALAPAAEKLLNTDDRQHVHSYVFNTERGNRQWPSKAIIEMAFDTISRKAGADDILVIFFAGHGLLPEGQKNLYLLTADASSFDISGVEKQVSISTEELKDWMIKIKANKQILVLDACNSGQAIQNLLDLIKSRDVPADQQRALENLKDRTGTYILAASASGQPAYETSFYSQGLLTYGLLSEIKSGGALKENKYIDVTRWFNGASDEVKLLSKDIGGRQDPQILGSASFEVGLVDSEVVNGIKLSARKKIFSRTRIVGDVDALSDEFGLSVLVDRELMNLSARGKESPLAYAANNTLADAYSVRGKYDIINSGITAKISLYKGEKDRVYEFEIKGATDKKEQLAKDIVEKIHSFLNE